MKELEARPLRSAARSLSALVLGVCVLGSAGCGSRVLDSRCRIDAGGHKVQVAKSVTKSKLWRTYFDKIPDNTALIELKVDVERRTKKSYGGDYDAGTVTFVFEARSIKHGKRLLQEEGTFELDMFLIGNFGKEITREEMQEIAFQDAEKEAYPFLDRWVKLAAIKAMGLEGKQGAPFVPTLKSLLEDKWTSGDMRGATEDALARIQGKA